MHLNISMEYVQVRWLTESQTTGFSSRSDDSWKHVVVTEDRLSICLVIPRHSVVLVDDWYDAKRCELVELRMCIPVACMYICFVLASLILLVSGLDVIGASRCHRRQPEPLSCEVIWDGILISLSVINQTMLLLCVCVYIILEHSPFAVVLISHITRVHTSHRAETMWLYRLLDHRIKHWYFFSCLNMDTYLVDNGLHDQMCRFYIYTHKCTHSGHKILVSFQVREVTLRDENLSNVEAQPMEHHFICAHHCGKYVQSCHLKQMIVWSQE